jgi:lipopolysaccharide export system ATP-binding protein
MTENKNPLLEIQNLKKIYQHKSVVDNFSLQLHESEIVGLLGPNGAGKTTLFSLIIGLIRADSGKILFQNEDITNTPLHKRALKGMGYLSQEPSIFRSLTVEQNLMAILETLPLSKKERKERLYQLLNELHLMHLRKKISTSLSGGERRRLEITRALIREPKLLLLDEPFANIDPMTIAEVKKLILLLKQKNITILITDHNAREIFSIVDRSYIMQDGQMLLAGTKEELLANPVARNQYLGEDFSL